MPEYKVVNSKQLDSDIELIANAIREKTGDPSTQKYTFPNGMANAIENLTVYKVQFPITSVSGSKPTERSYKKVDSSALDGKIETLCNAIRNKTKISNKLQFPGEVIGAINSILTQEPEDYYLTSGVYSSPRTTVSCEPFTAYVNGTLYITMSSGYPYYDTYESSIDFVRVEVYEDTGFNYYRFFDGEGNDLNEWMQSESDYWGYVIDTEEYHIGAQYVTYSCAQFLETYFDYTPYGNDQIEPVSHKTIPAGTYKMTNSTLNEHSSGEYMGSLGSGWCGAPEMKLNNIVLQIYVNNSGNVDILYYEGGYEVLGGIGYGDSLSFDTDASVAEDFWHVFTAIFTPI